MSKSKSQKRIDVAPTTEAPQGDLVTVGIRLATDDLRRLAEVARARRLRVGTMGRVALCEWLDRAEAAA